jgi:hypothetical protein
VVAGGTSSITPLLEAIEAETAIPPEARGIPALLRRELLELGRPLSIRIA